jgi:type IV secretory pathway VirB10-like protein
MSKYFRPWNIDQTLLLPPNVQDFVPKGHVSRFIVELVRESLDLKEITGSYVSGLGQPPFEPRMMVALLLHGYASGLYTAQVTGNVYDSPTGRFLLIPQVARLIGIYDSQVAFGQSRVLLVWTRLIMPNGRSIVLERQPGADTSGFSGLEDEVDNHWVALFKAALLSTLLGVGSELGTTSGTGSNSDVITALRRGSSDSLNQTGQKVVQQNLNIQPTLTIRPGFPVRVIVNRDLVLEPYKG